MRLQKLFQEALHSKVVWRAGTLVGAQVCLTEGSRLKSGPFLFYSSNCMGDYTVCVRASTSVFSGFETAGPIQH